MATVYFSVFHRVLVPTSGWKLGPVKWKLRNHPHEHSTQWFCSESPVFTSFRCEIGVIWWNGWQSQTVARCAVVFPWQQIGTLSSCGALVADSPVGSNHLHRLTLVWNKQGRQGVGETGGVLGVSTFYFLPNESFWVSQQVCLCLGTMFLFIPYTVSRQKKENKSFDKGAHPLLLCFTLELVALIYIFFLKKVTSNHSLCPQSSLCFYCLSADLTINMLSVSNPVGAGEDR